MAFLKKNKLILFEILLFICIFLVAFFVSCVCMPLCCDEVWTYGFSYNISKGMVIYRDFNVLQMPLYFLIGSAFITIFGDYVISLGVFNAILIALIGIMMYKIIGWKFLGCLPIITVFLPSGYNLFCLFWIILILYLINKKNDNDFLIGIIVGLCFITKQNVGVCLFLPYLIYSKNKIKSLFSFLLPCLFLIVYLVYYECLFEFIDYCFLGLFDFNNKNGWFVDVFVVLEIFSIMYLIFELFKSKFKNKEIFYILMFQIMSYPIVNAYHFFVSFVPVLFYIVKQIKNVQMVCINIFTVFIFNIFLILGLDINVSKGDNMLFLRNSGDLLLFLEDAKVELERRNYSLNDDYYFFTEYFGYLFKLYYDIPINKFDFLMTGNLGYNGVNRKIEELDLICNDKKCIFFVNDYIAASDTSQWRELYKYVVDNYYYDDDSFYSFDVYTN